MPSCECMEYLGFVTAAYLALKIGIGLLQCVRKSFFSSPTNVTKMGEWALVTGSTDGIGKAYAFALAKRGMNIVLVSRSPFKLQNVAAEVEAKYKVKTKIIDVDFSHDEETFKDKLESEIKDLEIGVLVNNVGVSYEHPEEFLRIENGQQKIKNILNVNITSVNLMTRLILPHMVSRKKGVLINISSMSGMIPSPLLSVYAASKAYVDKFTSDLEVEYGRYGIVIQCILPGYVVSNMSKLRKPTLIAPTPEAFVKSALARLGIYSRTTGYWSHDIMAWAVNTLPFGLGAAITYRQIKAIRDKALRKKAKEEKSQ